MSSGGYVPASGGGGTPMPLLRTIKFRTSSPGGAMGEAGSGGVAVAGVGVWAVGWAGAGAGVFFVAAFMSDKREDGPRGRGGVKPGEFLKAGRPVSGELPVLRS